MNTPLEPMTWKRHSIVLQTVIRAFSRKWEGEVVMWWMWSIVSPHLQLWPGSHWTRGQRFPDSVCDCGTLLLGLPPTYPIPIKKVALAWLDPFCHHLQHSQGTQYRLYSFIHSPALPYGMQFFEFRTDFDEGAIILTELRRNPEYIISNLWCKFLFIELIPYVVMIVLNGLIWRRVQSLVQMRTEVGIEPGASWRQTWWKERSLLSCRLIKLDTT